MRPTRFPRKSAGSVGPVPSPGGVLQRAVKRKIMIKNRTPNVDLLKFKLTIAYDGTNYAGWQVQKTGLGVQQRVEEALRKFFPSVRRIHSSSRTDSGVHAL